ncbi:MAG: hypothetical protein D6746_08795 [Bacteroidetes bacterium]|nr:MAG: hypothetical protein D6746_08795 [Bacteroidota bacterium]
MKLVLDPDGVNGDPEIVTVTAHSASGTTVTVTRGAEGTTARQHGSGTKWVLAATAAQWTSTLNAAAGALPVGALVPYAGTSSPDTTHWLLCDGSAVSRTTYATLFGVIGTTFGAGDGATTFNLPDLRGRAVFGLDNMGGTAANRVTDPAGITLGGTVGAETVTLTVNELPAHAHTGATGSNGDHWHSVSITSGSAGSHTHSFSATTSTNGSHTHAPGQADLTAGTSFVVGVSGNLGDYNPSSIAATNAGAWDGATATASGGSHNHSVSGTTGSAGSHTHLVSGNTGTTGAHTHTITSEGGGAAHQNMQPSMAVGWLIKAA